MLIIIYYHTLYMYYKYIIIYYNTIKIVKYLIYYQYIIFHEHYEVVSKFRKFNGNKRECTAEDWYEFLNKLCTACIMLFAMKHCQTRFVIMKPNVPPCSTSDDQPTIVSLSVFNFPFATLFFYQSWRTHARF